MNRFISETQQEINTKCEKIGETEQSIFFDGVPSEMKLKDDITLPEALGEYDLRKVMQNLAGRNISASDAICFLGAGTYDHFIPSAVTRLSREFVLLDIDSKYKYLNDYCSYMKSLTGMDCISVTSRNTADAFLQIIEKLPEISSRKTVLVARSADPEVRRAINSYAEALSYKIREIPCADGDTDIEELNNMLDENVAAVFVQSPNYFGIIENMSAISEKTHNNGSVLISAVDPVSLAIYKTPGEYDADFTIGNAQPLGGCMNYGTPFIAVFGMKNKYVHLFADDIPEERNGKTVCTNESKIPFHSAITVACYLELMGMEGLLQVAKTCYSNALFTYERLTATTSFKPLFNKPFFREFAVKAVKKNVNDINNRMLDYGMIGGMGIKQDYPEFGNSWLVAVTEKRSADEVELLVKEASRQI